MKYPDENLIIKPGAIKEAVLSAYSYDSNSSTRSEQDISSCDSLSKSIIFRETCQYCILSNSILGSLTLTRESLTFEPDLRDIKVDEKASGLYQVHIDLQNIIECGCIGGPSDELISLDYIRCNGFLQIIVKSFKEYDNDRIKSYSTSSLLTTGLYKLTSAVNIALSSTSITPGYMKSKSYAGSMKGINNNNNISVMKSGNNSSIKGKMKNNNKGGGGVVTERSEGGGLRSTNIKNDNNTTTTTTTTTNLFIDNSLSDDAKNEIYNPSDNTRIINQPSHHQKYIQDVRNIKGTSQQFTSVLFGFFNKDLAHKCTSLLMDILDLYKTKVIIPNRIGITRIPFSSNSLIDSWSYNNNNDDNDTKWEIHNSIIHEDIINILDHELISNKSNILTPTMIIELVKNLPPSIAIREWNLSFEIDHDGISFQTLYKKLDKQNNCLIIIQDSDGSKFGAFTGPIYSNFKFYGSGETFVFKFINDNNIKIYKSKSKNRCFIFSNDNNIIIGGGEQPAISIGQGFISGTSGVSDTFGNDQLSIQSQFSIKFMEVWTFGNFISK